MNRKDKYMTNTGQLYDNEIINVNEKFIGYKKLNQLININRNGITSLMVDLMDKMLSISQKHIYNSKEKVMVESLYNTIYHISASELLGNRSRKNFNFIHEQVKKLSELRVECIDDKYNFGVINIFQSLYYNSYEDIFEYTNSDGSRLDYRMRINPEEYKKIIKNNEKCSLFEFFITKKDAEKYMYTGNNGLFSIKT